MVTCKNGFYRSDDCVKEYLSYFPYLQLKFKKNFPSVQQEGVGPVNPEFDFDGYSMDNIPV